MEELSSGLKGKKQRLPYTVGNYCFVYWKRGGGLAWTIGTDEVSVIQVGLSRFCLHYVESKSFLLLLFLFVYTVLVYEHFYLSGFCHTIYCFLNEQASDYCLHLSIFLALRTVFAFVLPQLFLLQFFLLTCYLLFSSL